MCNNNYDRHTEPSPIVWRLLAHVCIDADDRSEIAETKLERHRDVTDSSRLAVVHWVLASHRSHGEEAEHRRTVPSEGTGDSGVSSDENQETADIPRNGSFVFRKREKHNKANE